LGNIEKLTTVLDEIGWGHVKKTGLGQFNYIYMYVGCNFESNIAVPLSQLQVLTSDTNLNVLISAGKENAGRVFNVFVQKVYY